jgi:hypothetical protein
MVNIPILKNPRSNLLKYLLIEKIKMSKLSNSPGAKRQSFKLLIVRYTFLLRMIQIDR